ncbi:MAG: acyl carrier protein [Clostridia bacterium]|nr:acyl carrier protein [Clostridia bacterium]
MIFEKITEILAEQLAADQNTMTMDTKIAEDLGADSLDLVDLLMSMEDEFGIEITDEDAADLHTIGDVVNFISKNSEQ